MGVVPVIAQGSEETQEVRTYLGSEVTLCHERLAKKINLDGDKLKFTLTGVNGSAEVEESARKYCGEIFGRCYCCCIA